MNKSFDCKLLSMTCMVRCAAAAATFDVSSQLNKKSYRDISIAKERIRMVIKSRAKRKNKTDERKILK